MAHGYEALAEQAAQKNLPYCDFLEQVLESEANVRQERNIKVRTQLAGFPDLKRLEQFDFKFPTPSTRRRFANWRVCVSQADGNGECKVPECDTLVPMTAAPKGLQAITLRVEKIADERPAIEQARLRCSAGPKTAVRRLQNLTEILGLDLRTIAR